MAEGISIGDAVMTFFGDTTKLDQSYADVQAGAVKTEAVIATTQGSAGEAFNKTAVQVDGLNEEMAVGQNGAVRLGETMTLAGTEAKESMYQARGEVQLLGEEFGVRLPRHVRSFLAELPGVGSALSAAFSITAVAFLGEALVQVSEKIGSFVGELLYTDEANKNIMKSTADLNKELLALGEEYEKLKKQVDDYGKSELALAQQGHAEAKESAASLTKQFADEEKQIKDLEAATDTHKKTVLSATDAYMGWVAGTYSLGTAVLGYTKGLNGATESAQKLQEVEAQHIITNEKLKMANEQVALSSDVVGTKQDELNKKYAEAVDKLVATTQEEIKLDMNFRTATVAIGKQADEVEELVIKMPEAAAGFLKIGAAMQTVGINTVDLANDLAKQKDAVDTLYGAYQKGNATLRQVQQGELSEVRAQIALAQAQGVSTAALEKYEAALQRSLGADNVKLKNYEKLTQADKQFMETLKQTGSVSQAAWEASANAMGSAVAAYAKGSESIGQALKSMLQQELASLAERAVIKSIEQLALGFGTMFTNPPESASHFTSAALWGTIGAGAAVAGHALGGGSGSSGSSSSASGGASKSNPATASTAQAPTTVINVQRLAGGGMVSAPTLAMVGDSPSGGSQKEAILPLEDGGVMDSLASAITKRMGGGSGSPAVHIHVQGLISPDNLGKVITQMNQRVTSGKSHLTSSAALRVTKRSQ